MRMLIFRRRHIGLLLKGHVKASDGGKPGVGSNLRPVWRLVRLQGLAQHRQVLPGHLAVQRQVQGKEALPEMVTEFSEELWGSLVDHVTVHNKDNIVFTLTSGMEIKA